VERAARRGDDILLGESLMAYLLCNDVIDPRRSEELFAEAFACIERSGDLLTGYVLHNNAGVHALRAGQIADARAHLEQAARSGREIGERSHHVEVNLGWVLRAEGVLDEARSKFAEGLRLSRRSGEQAGLAYSVLGLACVETEQGDARRAGKLHGIAQALLDAAGEPWQEPEVTYREASLGSLRALLGDQQFDEAYGEGMALRPDDAFDLAIGRTRQA
jgi:tetratricopeptide (TPR) repeat protein